MEFGRVAGRRELNRKRQSVRGGKGEVGWVKGVKGVKGMKGGGGTGRPRTLNSS